MPLAFHQRTQEFFSGTGQDGHKKRFTRDQGFFIKDSGIFIMANAPI